MVMRSRLIAVGAGTLLVAGCAQNLANRHIGDEDPALGEAVRYNAAVQTLNPEPVYAENSAIPGGNADRGAQAIRRYRTDQANARHKAEANSSRSSALSTTQGTAGPR
jgi:hypothetical protein